MPSTPPVPAAPTVPLAPTPARPAAWLLLVATGCALLVAAVHHVFVGTARGQLVDSASFVGAQIGRSRIIEPVSQVLDVVSVGGLAVAGLLAAAVAVLRRRFALAAVALALVLGSNVTTQLLKYSLLDRPDLGVSAAGMRGNTLPSGHTTVAMSLAAAALLVAPSRLRGLVAVLAAGYGAATGVATLSAGYHRPSDAIAAALVVGAWAAGLGAVVVLTTRPRDGRAPARSQAHPVVAGLLTGGALVLLAGGALATYATARRLPGDLDREQLLVAYAGGAALIAGTALAVVAALTVVVHRIVPPLPARADAAVAA